MIGVNKKTVQLLLELAREIVAGNIRIDEITVHNETVEDTINGQSFAAHTGTRILTLRWYDKGLDNRREAARKILRN